MNKNQSYYQKNDQELVELSLENQENFLYLMKRYEQKLLRYILRISNISSEFYCYLAVKAVHRSLFNSLGIRSYFAGAQGNLKNLMKKYSKVGNLKGKLAYRTPSSFRTNKNYQTKKRQSK